jgi:hypothetical protein
MARTGLAHEVNTDIRISQRRCGQTEDTMRGIILAYIDPGVGSMLLQGLLAGLFAIAFFYKRIKNWVIGLFRKQQDRKDD